MSKAKHLNPEELEAKIVEQEKVAEVNNPEDTAAAFFQKRLPVLKGIVKKLSMNQLRRVLVNVASYPLTEKDYLPKEQIERDAVYHFSSLIMEKTVMQLYHEQQKALDAISKNKEVNDVQLTEGDKNNVIS